ncbi:MAG: sulfurtransferase TusA family protein [Nitrospirae bacterium]|nr:sulfurtransferase TusA family protein [Nitrospirota bacterium]
MAETKIDKVLDVKGMVCPKPMIETKSALKSLEKGQVLQVITTDSSTKHSIPGLCEREGAKIIEMKEDAGNFTFIIQKQLQNTLTTEHTEK